MFAVLAIISVIAFSVRGQQCDNNAVYYTQTQKCYRTTPSTMTADSARQYCVEQGGDLASIHSMAENSFIFENVLNSSHSPSWIGLSYTHSTYVWSDESPMDYLNWDDGCPTDHTVCGCPTIDVHMLYGRMLGGKDGGQWDNCALSTDSYFGVCKLNSKTPSGGGCPSGSLSHNGKCYLFEDTRLSYDDARNFCVFHKGDLVSICSTEENVWVAEQAQSLEIANYWIGMNATTQSWTDSQTCVYRNWNMLGLQTCINGLQDCTSVLSMDQQWYACWVCSQPLAFVCEVQAL